MIEYPVYIIVLTSELGCLPTIVNQRIQQGYECVGGPFIRDSLACQAMINPDDDDEESSESYSKYESHTSQLRLTGSVDLIGHALESLESDGWTVRDREQQLRGYGVDDDSYLVVKINPSPEYFKSTREAKDD